MITTKYGHVEAGIGGDYCDVVAIGVRENGTVTLVTTYEHAADVIAVVKAVLEKLNCDRLN